MTGPVNEANAHGEPFALSRRGILGGAVSLALGGAMIVNPFGAITDTRAALLDATPTAGPSMAALAKAIRRRSFSQANVDALVAALAQAGIAVFPAAASTKPLVAVSSSPSPVRLLSWQAHNLALEISSRSGRTGTAL